jgi:CRP-like cAMP-binding protein
MQCKGDARGQSLIFLNVGRRLSVHSANMPASQLSLLSESPLQVVSSGSVLMRRAVREPFAIFIESGRVALGIAAAADEVGNVLEHQLGMVEGPGWLEINTAVLDLPGAVDAVAETDVRLRRVPLAQFRASLSGNSQGALAVLTDMARAYRRQTELAVSRLAKDAEARCAEWLLQHAESSDKGVCSVRLQQRKRLIAAQLGIAPETLSRVLRHLRERSLISGSGRVVNLVDPGGLRSLAGV